MKIPNHIAAIVLLWPLAFGPARAAGGQKLAAPAAAARTLFRSPTPDIAELRLVLPCAGDAPVQTQLREAARDVLAAQPGDETLALLAHPLILTQLEPGQRVEVQRRAHGLAAEKARAVEVMIGQARRSWEAPEAAAPALKAPAPVTLRSQGKDLLEVWRGTWSRYKLRHDAASKAGDPIVKDSTAFMADVTGLGKLWWLRGGHYGARISLSVAQNQARVVLNRHFLPQAPEALAPYEDFVRRLIAWRGGKGFPSRTRRMIRDALKEASLLPAAEVAAYFCGLLPQAELERVRLFRENEQTKILDSFVVETKALIAERGSAGGARPYNVVAVGLTGSYVYGTATPESDLDVAVITRDGTDADVADFMERLGARGKELGWPVWKDWARHRNVYPPSQPVLARLYGELPRMFVSPYPDVVARLGGERVDVEFWRPSRLIEATHGVFDSAKRAAMRVLIASWDRAARAPRAPKDYSDWLAAFQRELALKRGIERVYIGGGSALAVLDHLTMGRPLDMRDFDVFIVSGRPVQEDFLLGLGRGLSDPRLGHFSAADTRPRLRANLGLPAPQRYSYVAGYGSFWRRGDRTLDLSVFHRDSDMGLNGTFDVEKVLIPLDAQTSLMDWLRRHAGESYESLRRSGAVLDADGGYESWRRGNPRVVNWEKIRSDPATEVIRMARLYTRMGFTDWPQGVAARVVGEVERGQPSGALQTARNLLKLLSDARPAVGLKMVSGAGGAGLVPIELKKLVDRLSLRALDVSLGRQAGGTALALSRLNVLLGALEPRLRLPMLAIMARVEPAWADGRIAAIVSKELGLDVKTALAAAGRDRSIARSAQEEIARVVNSSALPLIRRRELLVRAILRRLPEKERPAALERLWPGLDENASRRVLDSAGRLRIGFLTGVFNPFHRGHRAIVIGAVEQMVLDRFIVMPTPKTNHNETPIDWGLRLDMARAGVRGIPEASVISGDYAGAFEGGGTGAAVSRLKGELGEGAEWVHAMGADSYARRTQNGYGGGTFAYRNEIFVVARPGHSLDIPPAVADSIHAFGLDVLEFPESARSSTVVRRLRAQGQPISDMVPAGVEDYIVERGLYAP